ncbi:MAG TPA: alpha/beta fold hydrolase [Candidatus Polarisedimenticolia bacterium]|nr:alpha/beta fold hydrolase [Candidatus Polarisedimenticolia bacterium]
MSLLHRTTRWLLILLAFGASLLAAVVLVFAIQARHRLPELRPWHRLALQDFTAGAPGAPATFQDYRRLEDRLAAEVRGRILDNPAAADKMVYGRYNPASVPSHLALDTPYNHSYELTPAGEIQCGVLLVHGLSDSPYSMRTIGEIFQRQGCYVVVLRLPGHGTVPSGLLKVRWQDWYGAVVLAAKQVAARASGKPLLAGGHSTGAALVSLYSVRAQADSSLPRPARIYLVSPAIGISKAAVLTNILASLSFLPRFEKSAWLDVLPEFDPYKYNSFPVNAANQIHRLTRVLRAELLDAVEKKQLAGMPKVMVFQSLVDSTVTSAEVVHGLLELLPRGDNELVVFDINREEKIQGFLAAGPVEQLKRLRAAGDLPYRVTIIGNPSEATDRIASMSRIAGSNDFVQEDLPLTWPAGIFSLGHVALPFPPDDPVYGLEPAAGEGPRFNLGGIMARGESGALVVPLGMFSRLRCNPFFSVIQKKIEESLR